MRLGTFASLAVATLALGAGCSTSETAGGGPTVLGPPSFTIDSVNGATPGAGTTDVTLGCDGALWVRVSVTNWSMRPPGACYGGVQCGQLALIVDPTPGADAGEGGALVTTSAAPLVQADLGGLASPEGTHVLRLELWNDGEAKAATGSDGKPLAQQITVEVTRAAECDAGAEAGDAGEEADADAGEGTDAGADAEQEADAAEEEAGAGDAEAEADAGESDAESDAGAEADAESEAESDAGSDAEADATLD